MPFKMLEAEDGTLNAGAAIRALFSLPSAPTVELESSGRKCVELNATGECLAGLHPKLQILLLFGFLSPMHQLVEELLIR